MLSKFFKKLLRIFGSDEKIEPDIWELPEKIYKREVKIQFAPPKWLSPSEVWFLYYRKFLDTDLDAMLYDWESRRYVSILKSDEYNVIKKLKLLRSDRQYEQSFWDLLFWKEWKIGHNLYSMNENLSSDYNRISIILANYCKDNWWLDFHLKDDKIPRIPIPVSIFNLVSSIFIFCFLFFIFVAPFDLIRSFLNIDNNSCGRLIFWIICLYVVIFIINSIIDLYNFNYFKNDKKICWVRLTGKWKDLFVQIYWYKYFLEKCDENKYKELCSKDKTFFDKTLPYIIALRLNSCFLKDLSVVHYNGDKIYSIWAN